MNKAKITLKLPADILKKIYAEAAEEFAKLAENQADMVMEGHVTKVEEKMHWMGNRIAKMIRERIKKKDWNKAYEVELK